MAWTQSDITALKAAMAGGEKAFTTRHGDTMVQKEFRSLDEMRSLLAEMEAEVGGGANGGEPPRRTVAGFSKGF